MEKAHRLKIAVQKSGRLAEKSVSLLAKCGLDFDLKHSRLFHECKDFPIDLMFVRDDDIPEYVADGVCQLGIVGENVLKEKQAVKKVGGTDAIRVLAKLGFGKCRLSLAIPEESNLSGMSDMNGWTIATSYPGSLKQFLDLNKIDAKIVELSGSVEIAPKLNISDAVCDLVSTGGTLKSNGLRELMAIFESEAVMIFTEKSLSASTTLDLERFMRRVDGVIRANQSKYIMMNAPKKALDEIRRIIPGMEEPSIMPLGAGDERIAIHAVAREALFWDTLESLKAVGASSILVLPIEKIVP